MKPAPPSAEQRWLINLAICSALPLPENPDLAKSFLNTAVRGAGTHFLPAILTHLKHLGLFEQLPIDLRDALQPRLFRALNRHLRQEAWLDPFLRHTLPDDLPVILLKGWAFNRTLYPEDTPRLCGDIDLFVRDGDADRLAALLEKECPPTTPSTEHPDPSYYELSFQVGSPPGIRVDLHRALFQPDLIPIDDKALWLRSRPHPAYADPKIRLLAPEDALLHLAANALIDRLIAPHTLVDAGRLIHAWNPDLHIVRQRAREWGIRIITDRFLDQLSRVWENGPPLAPSPPAHPTAARQWLAERYLSVAPLTAPQSWLRERTSQLLSLGLLDQPLRAVPFLFNYLRHQILK